MKPFLTLELNEDFVGFAIYIGYFDQEDTFEIVMQLGRLEIAVGIDFGGDR